MDNIDTTTIWTSVPKIQKIQLQIKESLNNDLLLIVLSVIQDGVCFISTDLRVIYSNIALKMWYGYTKEDIGEHCYQVYHFRTEPCEDCPVLKAVSSRQPETSIQLFRTKNGKKGWHRLFCVPVFNAEGELLAVIEYVRDITNEKKSSLEKQMVEKQNQILQDISAHQVEELQKKEQHLAKNINRAVDATLDYLKDILDSGSYEIVRSQLTMAMTGLPRQEEEIISRLTEKERMIARLVRDGYMSKEIAARLCISKKAVDYHRTNLRKKLGLGGDENLLSYLKEHLKTI